MSDSKLQFTSHCPNDDHPFIISSNLQFPTSHTPQDQLQIETSIKDYQNYHRNSPRPLEYHQPHSHHLNIFDPNFQVSTNHGPGNLLPIPVPYEDFQYPTISNVELPNQQVASSAIRSIDLQQQQTNPALIYTSYPIDAAPYGANCHLPLMATTSWDLVPGNPNQLLGSSNLPQDILFPQFLSDPVQYGSTQSSSAFHPIPTSTPIDSIPMLSNHQNADHPLHNPIHPSSSDNTHMTYPLPNPPTPPLLFDANEHDLLSSFLNIFGDSRREREFDPQGLPENMPALGELKRRLEEDGRGCSLQYPTKREADDVGRQVETRLNICDPESVYPKRPSLKSFHTTSGSLSSSSDSHLYQDQNFQSRKRAKTTNLSDPFPHLHPSHLLEPPVHHCLDSEGDSKMERWEYNPQCEHANWHSAIIPHGSHSDRPQPSQLSKSIKSTFSQSAPLSPVSQPKSAQHVIDNAFNSFRTEASSTSQKVFENQMPSTNPKSGSKRGSKLPKSTHIVSEQRRRNAIQGGFGNLVEILRAGEAVSGISIALAESSNPPNSTHQNNENNGASTSTTTTVSNPPKPKTRGRGRRGEIETGASKSVVLEKAAEFVQWMIDGNLALKNEVERVENILKNHSVNA